MSEACVDAVVVAYRSAELLPDCLASLRAEPSIGTITVVDHGDDKSDRLARDLGADLVISDPSNPGFGAGQNLGVGAGELPYILLCNPDARILPGVIQQGLEVLSGEEHVAAVQGVIADPDSGAIDRSAGDEIGPRHLWSRALGLKPLTRFSMARRLARLAGMGDAIDRVPDTTKDVETLAATAPLLRRSAFESIDGFDDSYFLYGEDLDLCRRLRSRGWRLIALPSPWAQHREGASSSTTTARERVWWGGTIRFAELWWSPARRRSALVASAVAALRFGHGRPGVTKANWRSMVTEPRQARRAVRG